MPLDDARADRIVTRTTLRVPDVLRLCR